MVSATELVSNSISLVSLPQIYLRVKQIIEDDNASLRDLVQCIAFDPSLTAQLLRMANVAFWAPRYRIETISRAVEVLGMSHVHDLVLATAVSSVFKEMNSPYITVEKFWKKSVFSAIAASILGKQCELIDVQRPFVEGLLSDIGHMVLYQSVPNLALKAFDLAQGDIEKIAVFERELIGCDFMQVGAELAVKWKLPTCFSTVIANQNKPELAGSHAFECAIVHIANRLAHQELEKPDVDLAKIIAPVTWELTGLNEECLPDVRHEAQQNMLATIHMFMQ